MAERQQFARSFDGAVDAYERGRPGYPAGAVEFLVGAARAILDLAAGTGKLTASLLGAGRDVVAVEPLDGMRTALADRLPEVRALAGSAERIPLPDGCVDAVTIAQAWHWFDEASAAREIARVLRPGGTVGAIWNYVDQDVPWAGAIWARVHEVALRTEVAGEDAPAFGDQFGPAEPAEFAHSQSVDRDMLRELIRSRSYVIRLAAADRERLLNDVIGIIDSYPRLRDRTVLDLPYRTRCWRASLRA